MNAEFYTKVEAFLNDELSATDRQAFEVELQNNKDFAAEFDLYQRVTQSLSHQIQSQEKNAELKKTLENLSGDFFQVEEQPVAEVVPLYRRYWKVVVGIAAAILIFFSVIQLMVTPDLSYEQYAEVREKPLSWGMYSTSQRDNTLCSIKAEIKPDNENK